MTPEARPDVRCGNIKNSINIPFNLMLKEDGSLKNDDDLKNIFQDLGVNTKKEIICSCASGVTACII